MAYLMTVASVSPDQLNRLIGEPSQVLSPTRFEFVSHYLAYGVQARPLGALLRTAIDGGGLIHNELWHPFRAPLFHSPTAVQDLHQRIKIAWDAVLAEHELPADDWYRIEIDKLLSVFGYASAASECIVTTLHPPADVERANRVRMTLAT